MPGMVTIGIIGLIAILECWVFAVVLYRVGAPGSVARKLSLLLVFEGVTLFTAGYPVFAFDQPAELFKEHPVFSQVFFVAHTFGDCAMLALYPPFLAAALKTPLARPFAGRRGYVISSGVALALFVVMLAAPLRVGATLLYLSMALLFGYALAASIHAWLRAAAGTTRTRAQIFVMAFGLRDICWGFVYGAAIWMVWTGTLIPDDSALEPAVSLVYALGTLVAIPLIAYGILRTQLFDIDLRIRWTIKQSTLAGIFVAAMFLISEGASTFLSAELGNVAGLLAAAVLMFFLAPLQRFSERIASAAMPNTRNTPEYAAFRKLQVYEAALSEAIHEDGISDRERALLGHLRESLGIAETDAQAIEADLLAQARSDTG